MGQLFGKAAILWTPDSGPAVERAYLLRVPLQAVAPQKRERIYAADSLDYSSREVISVGAGVFELAGTIRYDDDPEGLLDLLAAGVRGVTLTYVPDTENDEEYPCHLIEPAGPIAALEPDADYDRVAEYTQRLLLRRTTGGAIL